MNDKVKVAIEKKIKRRKRERWRLVVFVWCCKKRMILSKEFYDKCCPTYKKAIDELEKKLSDIGVIERYHRNRDEWYADAQLKNEKVFDTIFNFAAKYLTPKEYWEYAMHYFDEFISRLPYEERKKVSLFTAKTAFFQHLYYNHAWNSINCTRNVNDGCEHFLNAYGSKRLKLLGFQMIHYLPEAFPNDYETYFATEKDFGYPHDNLKQCLRQYERKATRLPSGKLVQQYEQMRTLYDKIKAAKENVDEWFKLLLQVDDDGFVMDNVECRLGRDLFNVKLWKLYLTFLKGHGKTNRLVQMYSKYCRFFLEDSDMLEEYKAELAKHGKADVPLDQMYLLDVEEDVAEKEDVTQDDEIVPFDKNICSSFYATDRNQKFSLSKPLIRYIVKNAGHRVLRKLFQSCKYFYAKRPTPICYRLQTGVETTYKCENLTLQLTAKPELFMKKPYITGVIDNLNIIGDIFHVKLDFISSVIPRIHRCEAKYINLYFQNLTFDELKCLIQHGGVVELQVGTCRIKDKRDDFVDLEQILAYLPNIENLNLPSVKTNENTGTALTKFKFNGKINRFCINSVFGKPFNVDDFLKFCVANRDERWFKLAMFFNRGFNPEFVQSFKKTMVDYAKSCGNSTAFIDFVRDD